MSLREIRFGNWSLKPDTHVLALSGLCALLEPRVSDLLEFFLGRQDEVHTHDQLVHAVWDGRFVSDEAVRRGVCSLRQAMSTMSGGGSGDCIRTVYKKGYIAHFPPAHAVTPVVAFAGQPGTLPDASRQLIDDCRAFLLLHPAQQWRQEPDTGAALECLRLAADLGARVLAMLQTEVEVADADAA